MDLSKKNAITILLAIIFLGAVLRFYNLGATSLVADEFGQAAVHGDPHGDLLGRLGQLNMKHQGHVDPVENPQADELLLARQEGDLPLFPQLVGQKEFQASICLQLLDFFITVQASQTYQCIFNHSFGYN